MMARKNPTSPIRKGFDYQDILGLKLCGEWLNDPSRYKWIQFETIPEELQTNRFYLDDIVLSDRNGFYNLYQIKHKQNPEDRWTWKNLLDPTGNSLLKKWFQSLLRAELRNKVAGAFFITNGLPADEIGRYLEGDKIDIERIKLELSDIYARIKAELRDDGGVVDFFNTFRFSFGEKDLNDLEEAVKKYFYEELCATQSGVNNLLLQIQKECRKQRTTPLTLEQIKEWCEFEEPRALNENFNIPTDFEFFDENEHRRILESLEKQEGGIKVIYGKPGTGKSVYLSKVNELLQGKQIISIRHHYHISPEDPNPQERLNSDRVIEAIKAQFKHCRDDLGALANKNSGNIELREFITTLASTLNKKGKAFILIVDGLDHALRYEDARELKEFLRSICYPQPGLWIILGMQPVAKGHLPQVVLDRCPEREWVEIRGLNKAVVDRIVRRNAIKLNLPPDEAQLRVFIDKLFEITQGNPLHLRYMLKQLKNRLGNEVATEYQCRDLIPYGDDIATYYQALWRQLQEKAKTILLTIASVGFIFKRGQLFEYLASYEGNPTEITKSFDTISHLISEDKREKITVYHNSFERFLLEQPEFEQQRIPMKGNIKKWLEGSRYEDLKWAELRKIEYELGNSSHILALNRDWLIDAICHPRNPYQITSQMKLASKAAFENNDFSKAFAISHLLTYYLNSPQFVEEATEKIWEEALLTNDHVLDEIELEYSSPLVLEVLSGIANAKGDFEIVYETLEIMKDRQYGQRIAAKDRSAGMPPISRSLLLTIPYDRRHEPQRVYRYIKQFSDLGWTEDFFGVYSKSLLRLDQLKKVKELLTYELTSKERQEILDQCAAYDLEQGRTEFLEVIKNSLELSRFCHLYLCIRNQPKANLPPLPDYESLPESVPEYTREREKWAEFFLNNFLSALIYGLTGHAQEIEQWMEKAPRNWLSRATSFIFVSSLKIAGRMKAESKISYGELFGPFADLPKLRWPENREIFELQLGLRNSFNHILKRILLLKKGLGDDSIIKEEDTVTMFSKKFYWHDDLLDLILEVEEPLLSQEVFKTLLDKKGEELRRSITYFPDRAKDYARLAKLCRIHMDSTNSDALLRNAADNLLGYGYHKDLYLDGVLESIEFCACGGSIPDRINKWITRVSPTVESVTEYTDGDETNYLHLALARVLSAHNPGLLYKNYYSKAEDEDLLDAEDVFKYVIKSLRFDTDLQTALATTALDNDSLRELQKLAHVNNGARQSLTIIQNYFGGINYPPEEKTSSSSGSTSAPDYSSVTPTALGRHLDDFKSRWELKNYLVGWVNYWVNHGNREEIYDTLNSLIGDFGLKDTPGELIDLIYPLAYEFDNENAFEYLCWAQANDHGWQTHWTDRKKVEQRWNFLKEKYPLRYLEFFKKSVVYSTGTRTEAGYFVPIPRGVEFFVLFGDLERAEAITEASVCFAETLMANMSIPKPGWLVKPEDAVDELDILIQRLLWPSPLVRERAATALASLLAQSPQKEEVFERLLSWIGKQNIESVVAISLLPLIKAFEFRKEMNLAFITLERIASVIKVNSVVIGKLIDELAILTGQERGRVSLPTARNITQCPISYEVDKFFEKYVRTFLAPIYYTRAEEIEENSVEPFLKQWSFTAAEIARENNVASNPRVADFHGRKDDPTLTGMSSKLSEVYRSAFLRVLEFFYEKSHLQKDFYLEYAYATLPIDLSFWKIHPNRAPEWWPRLVYSGKSSENDLYQIGLREPIESLLKRDDKNILLAAEGAVEPEKGWGNESLMHSFSLIGFGYKVVGSLMPKAEDVAEFILHSPLVITIPSMVSRSFNFIENHEHHLPINTKPIRMKDLIIYPIVARARDLSIALWQFFKDFGGGSWVLNPYLKEGLSLKIVSNGWLYEDGGREVAVFRDWLEGLRERNESDLPIPHGQYAEADSSFIENYFIAKTLRLGYVLKTTYRYKKHSYSKVETIKDYKLLNVSGIIL